MSRSTTFSLSRRTHARGHRSARRPPPSLRWPRIATELKRRPAVLLVENLVSRYGRIEVLHGVSLSVAEGEIVTLVGSNGAGKTTLLRAISGVQPSVSGSIRFAGERIDALSAHRRVAKGIAQVPEGRQVFAPLTIEDNLRLGAVTRRDDGIDADLAEVYAMFPALEEKRHLPAGGLSGGQQQMLAIGRALMARPRLMLLDEPSMGLAPRLVEQIFATITDFKRRGLTVLLVEQNARAALAIADRGYVMETGRIAISGGGRALLDDDRVRAAYLGV
jgi:branched-chain amino acid transport system ATP-binding protein